jgi:DNA/RNA-binding domain of Phe-tRNA-synthetase-like protein
MLTLTIDPEIAPLLRVGKVEAAPVRVGPAGAALHGEISALCEGLASLHVGRQPSEIDGLGPGRRLYRAFGIDPTSTRPSSEALLRRILQGKPFPEVNSAVDVCNLCSVSFLLPIGLYDAAKICGGISLRRGRAGESFAGIRKDEVHLGGRPALVDDLGPFGNPTSDSLRTCVDPGTTSLLMVIFAPHEFPAALLDDHVTFARQAIARHLAG